MTTAIAGPTSSAQHQVFIKDISILPYLRQSSHQRQKSPSPADRQLLTAPKPQPNTHSEETTSNQALQRPMPPTIALRINGVPIKDVNNPLVVRTRSSSSPPTVSATATTSPVVVNSNGAYVKPILKKTGSTPTQSPLPELGSDSPAPVYTEAPASSPTTPKRKSLSFSSKIERICIFARMDTPCDIAKSPRVTGEDLCDIEAPTGCVNAEKSPPVPVWSMISRSTSLVPFTEGETMVRLDTVRLVPTSSDLGSRKGKHSVALVGSIIARNIAFEKKVTVRYTTDSWYSFSDVVASYRNSITLTMDRFEFTLDVDSVFPVDATSMETSPTKEGCHPIQFAIQYIVGGSSEYWDNNSGANYEAMLQLTFENKSASGEVADLPSSKPAFVLPAPVETVSPITSSTPSPASLSAQQTSPPSPPRSVSIRRRGISSLSCRFEEEEEDYLFSQPATLPPPIASSNVNDQSALVGGAGYHQVSVGSGLGYVCVFPFEQQHHQPSKRASQPRKQPRSNQQCFQPQQRQIAFQKPQPNAPFQAHQADVEIPFSNSAALFYLTHLAQTGGRYMSSSPTNSTNSMNRPASPSIRPSSPSIFGSRSSSPSLYSSSPDSHSSATSIRISIPTGSSPRSGGELGDSGSSSSRRLYANENDPYLGCSPPSPAMMFGACRA
ncbi:hypothetical protein HK102_004060 [Quaeritorhiza haematococci]|nr:hypothetical protein HK102_004060 [Quaeritorhiza haematococci]